MLTCQDSRAGELKLRLGGSKAQALYSLTLHTKSPAGSVHRFWNQRRTPAAARTCILHDGVVDRTQRGRALDPAHSMRVALRMTIIFHPLCTSWKKQQITFLYLSQWVLFQRKHKHSKRRHSSASFHINQVLTFYIVFTK